MDIYGNKLVNTIEAKPGLQITARPLANATKCCLWATRNQKLVAHLATRIQG